MKENKLIAKFMDFPTQRDAVDEDTIAYYVGESIMHTDNTNNQNDYDVFHPEDMQFHTSWDWLMPVVKKCFQTGDDTHQWDDIMDTIFTCDINIVYAQVVEFIKEYNKDYKTCDRCCYDIVDDDGDIMEHICIDDKLY